MYRAAVLVFVFALTSYGQFDELAATDDGRQLYFSSTLTLAGTPPDHGEYRIYRVVDSGIELFAERGSLASQNSFGSGDGAHTPQVSGDGQTVGLTLEGICDPGSQCLNSPWRAELRGRNAGIVGEGSLVMSRNGVWALLVPRPQPNGSSPATLINLDTGERTNVPSPPIGVTRPLASDGSVVVQQQDASGRITIGIWRQGQFSALASSGAIWGISDTGRVLVYSAFAGTPGSSRLRLVARDLLAGRETVLYSAAAPAQFIWPMGMSNDGQKVLYRVTGNALAGAAFIADTASGESQPLELPDGELASAGTLSGYGNIAFLVTSTGRIVAIDLASGSISTLVPATPWIRNLSAMSPGSLVRLEGTLPAAVEKLAGGILLDGRALPVLFASEQQVGVQVPWEVKSPSESALAVNVPGDSPFRQNQLLLVGGMVPRFEPLAPGESSSLGFKAIRGDFSGLLTTDPVPGEIFHVYATGLGRVQGQVETGSVTPIGAVFPIQGQFQCRFLPYTEDAETVFAGLAPGLIGIYQITFRMPQGPNLGHITGGSCHYGDGFGGGSLGWVQPIGRP